jgi:hypothetical protein
MSEIRLSIAFNVLNNAITDIIQQVKAQKTHRDKYQWQRVGFLMVAAQFIDGLEFAQNFGRMISGKEFLQIAKTARIIGKQTGREAISDFLKEEYTSIDIPQDFFTTYNIPKVMRKVFENKEFLQTRFSWAQELYPAMDMKNFKKGVEQGLKYFESFSIGKIQNESYLKELPHYDGWL